MSALGNGSSYFPFTNGNVMPNSIPTSTSGTTAKYETAAAGPVPYSSNTSYSYFKGGRRSKKHVKKQRKTRRKQKAGSKKRRLRKA